MDVHLVRRAGKVCWIGARLDLAGPGAKRGWVALAADGLSAAAIGLHDTPLAIGLFRMYCDARPYGVIRQLNFIKVNESGLVLCPAGHPHADTA
jgi:hypothetical protein